MCDIALTSGHCFPCGCRELNSHLHCKLACLNLCEVSAALTRNLTCRSLVAWQVVQRAREEDLNRLISYKVSFIRNSAGRVVTDVSTLHCEAPLSCNDRLPILLCMNGYTQSRVQTRYAAAWVRASDSAVQPFCDSPVDKADSAAVPLKLRSGEQRHFNTAHLLAHYMGDKALSGDAIAWNPNDPNILSIRLPGGSLAHQHGAWVVLDVSRCPSQRPLHAILAGWLFASASPGSQCAAVAGAAGVQVCAPAHAFDVQGPCTSCGVLGRSCSVCAQAGWASVRASRGARRRSLATLGAWTPLSSSSRHSAPRRRI